jgi:hypothetical protein
MENELIYPIYLDVPMMTSFLASIDNGIIESTEVETKNLGSEKKAKKGKLHAGISGVLGIFKAGIDGEISNEISTKLESNYKTNVKYPQSWLFNRLRNILKESERIINLTDFKQIVDIKIGDIVEFDGIASPEPSYIMRNTFNQLLPIVEPFFKIQIRQQQNLLNIVNDVRKNNNFEIDDKQKITLENKHIYKRNIELKISEIEDNLSLINLIKESINSLFPEKFSLHNLIFKCSEMSLICKIYKDYARNETIEDIHYGTWKVLGKVISKITEQNPYDLMKDSPFSYLPQTQFGDIVKSMNNENLMLPEMKSKITEDSLLIAPIGIFI